MGLSGSTEIVVKKGICKVKKIINNLLYIVMLLSFSILIVGYGSILNGHLFNPDLYLNHGYDKPFVTRVLPVWIMKFIYRSLNYDYMLIFKYMDIISLSLSGWFFYKYANTFLKNETISKIASFLIYFIIPFNMLLPRYVPIWYPYDSFGMMFFIMGLYFLRINNLFAFYLVLLVGTFNRETTLVLIAIFAVVHWGAVNKVKIASHICAQMALWFAIKILLSQYFSSSAGASLVPTLGNNLHFLSALDYYNLKLGDFERIFRYVFLLSNFGFVYLIVIFYWVKLDDVFLRRTTLTLIPFFISILFVGNMFEFRLYGELVPFVLMPAIYILIELINDGTSQSR